MSTSSESEDELGIKKEDEKKKVGGIFGRKVNRVKKAKNGVNNVKKQE